MHYKTSTNVVAKNPVAAVSQVNFGNFNCRTFPNEYFDGVLRENYPERMPLLRKPLYFLYFLNFRLVIKSSSPLFPVFMPH